jgi:hypothetical protein
MGFYGNFGNGFGLISCDDYSKKIFSYSLVEKRLLVAHQFGLCVAHMGCATIATPLVKIYQWRISICATHNLTMRGAYCYMRH